MSPNLQVKLLRVLQEQSFEPVGSSKTQVVDVRVIAATNQDLEQRIQEGLFREDLFYRLNVIPIEVPALRQRGEDVILLAQYFLEVMCRERGSKVDSISPEALAVLASHSWPGNVRELENLIERLTVMCGEGEITLDDLPSSLLQPRSAAPAGPTSSLPAEGLSFRDEVDRLESQLIRQALDRTGGNKNQAAQLLGLNRTTLLEKIKKKGLE